MNLFELFVKIGAKDEASGTISKIASGLGKGLATAAKIGTAAVATAAAGITALTTAAVNNYAEYEQLVGGVETLFGTRGAKTVEEYAAIVGKEVKYVSAEFEMLQKAQSVAMDNAADAYKNAGMSANEYMQTISGFAASLKQSTASELEAAEIGDMAVRDMADNANKMGTSMEAIQNAYAGFAKQNYTMLDNLKLGYGGTKTEMERLLEDAEELSGIEYDIDNLADVYNAIHVIQNEMGITGTTALEAGRTISGSVQSMKSAWTNLLTGLADGNADVGELVNNLVTTIVGDGTENNLGVLGNIMPAVKTALTGASKLVSELLPKIVEEVPAIINENIPILAEAAISIIQSLANGISQNQGMLMSTALETIVFLANSLISMLPQIVALGLDLIVSLANGIAESLPELMPTIVDVVLQIVDTLTSQEQLANILNAALMIIEKLAYGLMDAIPQLVDVCFTIIENIIDFLIDPANLGMILKAAFDIIIALGTGIVSSIPRLLEYWVKVPASIIENFKNTDWGKLGTDLVDGFKNGISRAWTNLKSWFKNLFGDLIGIAKKILGIASPSKVFKKLGVFTAEGFGIGFDEEFAKVKGDMEGALAFDDPSIGINSSVHTIGAKAAESRYGGTSIGNVNITVNGAKYDDEQSLAVAIAETIQNMTDRRIAVYA